MIDQQWRTALGRWGDLLWQVALAQRGDRAAAQRALVEAFEHVFATPPTDAQADLLHALLYPRRRDRLHMFRRARALPRPLRRVRSSTRVLLALWLVHDYDGPRLATVARCSHKALTDQIVTALVALLPRQDLGQRTKVGQAAFGQWVRQQLGFQATVPDAVLEAHAEPWQAAMEHVRTLLAKAVGGQRLPGGVRDAIEVEMTAVGEDAPSWQRWASGVAVAMVLFALVWALWPATAPTGTTANDATLLDARNLVQQTLDAWTTQPISGTLHRRVWSIESAASSRQSDASLTHIWLAADSERYRVETYHEGTLVEWQVADGNGRLRAAALLAHSPCPWAIDALDQRVRSFTLNATDIALARSARLTSGAYGEGYRLLRRAIAAPDLRSFGVRTEDGRPLATLGFRDELVSPPRTLLLLIDPSTRELQAVRELRDDATQTTARDLWRVEHQETLDSAVSSAAPSWPGEPIVSSRLIDPACPGLPEEKVLSLRILTNRVWGGQLPLPLPSGITHAVAIHNSDAATYGDGMETYNAQVVLFSDDGWITIKPINDWSVPELMEDQAPLHVEIEETASGYLSARVWNGFDQNSMSRPVPPIDMLAKGWTRDELIEVAHSLQPLNRSAWTALNEIFFDPHPLPIEMQQILAKAQQAIAPPPNGVIHTIVDHHVRTRSDQPTFEDPYHLPPEIYAPEQIIIEQWLEAKDSALVQYKHTKTTPDGTLLNALAINSVQIQQYDATMGLSQRHRLPEGRQPLRYSEVGEMLGIDAASSLLKWSTSITMTEEGSTLRFQQVLPLGPQEMLASFMWLPLQGRVFDNGWNADLQGGYMVQQIWLDRESLLLDRWSVTHVGEAQGTTAILTPVWTITVREYSILDTVNDDVWLPPPLPEETVIVEESPHGLQFVDNSFDPAPPARALVWTEASGIEVQSDRDYRNTVSVPEGWNESLWSLVYTSIEQLPSTGWVRTTRYQMPESAASITVVQGSTDVLRYALRRSYGHSDRMSERASEPIEVTVAGEQRTAWLLHNNGQSALVIEIDEVALYITGPEEYLRGVLPEHLPALEWVDVNLR